MESLLLALVIGLGVGCIVGALGAGGGILSVPALVYLLGQNPHAAGAGSLIIVGATALISLIPRTWEHRVRWKDGLIFGLCSTLATFLGSRLSFWVSGWVLMLLFGVLLVMVGMVMLWKAWQSARTAQRGSSGNGAAATEEAVNGEAVAGSGRDANAGGTGGAAADTTDNIINGAVEPRQRSQAQVRGWIGLLTAASFTGLLTGFFGVGGGFIVVPMLVLVLRFNIREASATSLLVMLLASITGLLSRIGTPLVVQWPAVIAFAMASMLGGLIGAPASRKVPEFALTLAFGVLLLLVAAGVLAAELC